MQGVDKKLLHLELSKGDLPKTVKKLKEDIENTDSLQKNIETTIQEIEQETRKTIGIVEYAEEKQKKYQNQLYDVTSNKEYDAITHEIEVQKKEIEEGTARIEELEMSKEENENSLKEYKEELEQLEKDLKEKEKELKNLLKTTEQKELELNQMREKIVVRLDKPILKRYERIRAAKNGIAVVTMERDACGGCFKTIPPQNIVEVEKLNKLHQCEVCGRILVPANELDRLPL